MNNSVIENGFGYAIYPSVKMLNYVKNKRTGKHQLKFVKELIFGDYIKLLLKEDGSLDEIVEKGKTYVKVRGRRRNGYLLLDEIQAERVLEVNFIDVAQGDGCHVVTPEDKHFIIDAGMGDNMLRFLNWRFNLTNPQNSSPEFTGIISHCDADHYGGFTKIFKKQRDGERLFSFDTIYQNGIVEESGSSYSKLGDIVETDQPYVTNLIKSRSGFNKRKNKVSKIGNYIKCLDATDANIKFLRHGSRPIYDQGNTKIEVLGPVTQNISNKEALPIFDKSKGRTKNGHSVILKLTIGKLRVLLGGDLNSTSENYLIDHFTGINIEAEQEKIKDPDSSASVRKKAKAKIEEAIIKARKHFEVDIAKSCHHGSADFTIDFLKVLNPIATVISSGDEESHSHPRPDTLGSIGKYSRGERSLIFSTELARSTKEYVKTVKSTSKKAKERTVTVYGMINVRTDGHQVIVAQKLEKNGASRNWDIHKIAWNEKLKAFEYQK